MDLVVRDIELADAEQIIGILNYISTFPARGIWKVALSQADRRLLGFQVVEPFGSYTAAFDHVGTIGTYVDLALRRRGVARALFDETFKAARAKGFEKFFTFVRADNAAALAAYRACGFEVIGTARQQARLDGRYVDEILIERTLSAA